MDIAAEAAASIMKVLGGPLRDGKTGRRGRSPGDQAKGSGAPEPRETDAATLDPLPGSIVFDGPVGPLAWRGGFVSL